MTRQEAAQRKLPACCYADIKIMRRRPGGPYLKYLPNLTIRFKLSIDKKKCMHSYIILRLVHHHKYKTSRDVPIIFWQVPVGFQDNTPCHTIRCSFIIKSYNQCIFIDYDFFICIKKGNLQSLHIVTSWIQLTEAVNTVCLWSFLFYHNSKKGEISSPIWKFLPWARLEMYTTVYSILEHIKG